MAVKTGMKCAFGETALCDTDNADYLIDPLSVIGQDGNRPSDPFQTFPMCRPCYDARRDAMLRGAGK